MNRKAIRYVLDGMELYLDPNSLAYQLYKENRLGELDKHLETIMRNGYV